MGGGIGRETVLKDRAAVEAEEAEDAEVGGGPRAEDGAVTEREMCNAPEEGAVTPERRARRMERASGRTYEVEVATKGERIPMPPREAGR